MLNIAIFWSIIKRKILLGGVFLNSGRKFNNLLKRICCYAIAFSTIIIIILVLMDILQVGTLIGLSQNYDWLSFFGTFLGIVVSVIVSVAVMLYTFHLQKEDDERKRQNEFRPIFQVEMLYKQDLFKHSGEVDSSDDDERFDFDNSMEIINLVDLQCDSSVVWAVLFKITNVGRSYAKSIRYTAEIDGESHNLLDTSNYRVLGIDRYHKCYLNIRVKDFKERHAITFKISCLDMYENSYTQNICLELGNCKATNIVVGDLQMDCTQ